MYELVSRSFSPCLFSWDELWKWSWEWLAGQLQTTRPDGKWEGSLGSQKDTVMTHMLVTLKGVLEWATVLHEQRSHKTEESQVLLSQGPYLQARRGVYCVNRVTWGLQDLTLIHMYTYLQWPTLFMQTIGKRVYNESSWNIRNWGSCSNLLLNHWVEAREPLSGYLHRPSSL